MSQRDETTSAGCLRAAFQGILREDYAERDRLCERAKALIAAEGEAAAVERILSADFYVSRNGIAVPTLKMAAVAGAIQ